MRSFTREELEEVLRLHKLWLNGDINGKVADLGGANLECADLYGAKLEQANLCKANLRGANLECANLYKANLEHANLRGANLMGVNLEHANLCKANLYKANLYKANLYKANLYKANLGEVNLIGANLGEVNLCKVNLCKANLYKANLRGVNLIGANLRGVNLIGANLRGIKGYYTPFPQEGSFVCYKKCIRNNVPYIITLIVESNSKRACKVGSRKLRVSMAKVLKIEDLNGNLITDKNFVCTGKTYKGIDYKLNSIVVPDSFNDSIVEDCVNGIHAFMTKEEAINY